MDLSDFVAQSVVNWMFRQIPMPPPPVELQIRLYNVLPKKDGTGGKEVKGGAYEPLVLVTRPGNFKDPAEPDRNLTHNLTELSYKQATTPWEWVVGAAIWAGDKLMTLGVFEEAEFIGVGGTYVFDLGEIEFSMD